MNAANSGILTKAKNIHFVGIGGIGMSGLACLLLERGYRVSGSDLKPSRLTKTIERKGGKVFFAHKASNLGEDIEAVVHSSSIDEKNPEILKARQENIPILHRMDVVAELFNAKIGISITGAHGKTTTTALSTLLLAVAGLDPTALIGGEVDFLDGNWRNGKTDFFVCEADESDGSFLKLKSNYAVLTNIDLEHMDYYGNLKAIMKANEAFINNIKNKGCLIASYDDVNIKQLLNRYKDKKGLKILTYSSLARRKSDTNRGFCEKDPNIYAKDIKMNQCHTSFNVIYKEKTLGKFELNIPGGHNVENSLAVILLGLELGLNIDVIRKALFRYKGACRRFQIKGTIDDIMIIEDYAHHPTEIVATICACKNWPGRRLVGVFQPHRYTRTKFSKKGFGKSFLALDELILTDIYSASEKPIEGITSEVIYNETIQNGQRNVHLLKKSEILPHLSKTLRSGDTVLILGAGDIGEISDELVKRLEAKRQGSARRTAV